MSIGYSGTPLAKKLGLKDNFNVSLYNQPSHYRSLFSDWPDSIQMIINIEEESVDFIHLFIHSFDELKKVFNGYKNSLTKDGLLWVSWPKMSSKIKTDLKRDIIREYGLGQGLVDVKIASIDQNWSGIKFVYRLKDR